MNSSPPDLPKIEFRRVRPADLHEVLALLENASLPAAGVQAAFDGFIVAECLGRIVGAAGLELHGRNGVLRSVVVDPGLRGQGIARGLTTRILEAAEAAQLSCLYLLTETAELYFEARGFLRIDRSEVPPPVRDSVEFKEACPASATAMVKDVRVTSSAALDT